ncbi:MAG: calcium/sodium antiporter [Anaerolineae bacterium]|nr:calcium/sodium antiporter [Anaerolineae bacterium]
MLEKFFLDLPLAGNVLLVGLSLYFVIRSSHVMVDGAVGIAHEFNISSLVIGATVVAVGTSAAELAINLVVVLSGDDTAAVVGNILGSNLVNFGIGLGVPALIAGLIVVPRTAMEREIPLYLAATGLMTAFVHNGEISRVEAVLMLALFIVALWLIVQYARVKESGSVLLVEMRTVEEIAHPTAHEKTRRAAMIALFGGLAALVLASRLLIFNTAAVAEALSIPEFVIGLVIIGPGTSMPEIATALQAVRRGHPDLVLGMAFGSNLFNLLFGLGLPALITPLVIEESAILGFTFMDVVNLTLLALLLLDFAWLGWARTINRVVGAYLLLSYLGYILYEIINAAGGTTNTWAAISAPLLAASLLVWFAGRGVITRRRGDLPSVYGTILVATRGGRDSQSTHARAIELAKERRAEVVFLYVFDPDVLRQVATPIVINVEAQIEHMLAYLQRTAQEEARRAGVPARVIVRTGSLRDQLQVVAQEEEVSLIVVGKPREQSTQIGLKALEAFMDEIEQVTGITVLALGGDPVPAAG